MKKNIFRICLVFAASGMHEVSNAQSRSETYTNTLNDFNRNAAYTGNNDNMTVLLDSKLINAHIDGQYQSLIFGAHTMLADNNAIGLKVMEKSESALRNLNIEMNYAKRFKLAENHFLTFGTNVGFVQTTINTSALSPFVDVSDPTINNGYFNQLRFTAGFGALYKFKKQVEVGLSTPMLVTGNEKINPSLIGNASYMYKPKPDSKWKITPGVVYYNFSGKSMLDAGVKGGWNDLLSLYVGYRTNGSLLTSLTVTTKSFSAGYAYNYCTGDINVLYLGTHELMLSVPMASPGRKQEAITEGNMSNVESRLQQLKEKLINISGSMETTSENEIKKKIRSANTELQKILREYKTDNVDSLSKQVKELNNIMDDIDKKRRMLYRKI